MSSILKALKKLEQEKTLRREGEIDLSREILQDAWRRKARFPRPLAAAITTIVLLLALITILLSRGTAPVQMVQTQTPGPPRETALPLEPKAAPPEVVPHGPAPAPARLQPATAAVPPPAAAPTQKQQPAGISLPLPPQPPPQTENQPSLPATASPPATLPPPPAKKPAAPAESAEPAFSVSGIAWNKDSADRLAIVNGQPLTTGSAIGGAVVEEILPDRVRFSRSGGNFEVHLGKAGKTN